MRDSLKSLVIDDKFFGALGFEYQGPIDGHDLKRMIRVLRRAKEAQRPVLVHVVTKKGTAMNRRRNRRTCSTAYRPLTWEGGHIVRKSGLKNGQVMAAELVGSRRQRHPRDGHHRRDARRHRLTHFKERHPDRSL